MRIDVTAALRPERAAFLDLLASLPAEDWDRPTECPAWTVKGIALHLLGDDLSLLARQRDAAPNSLLLYAQDHPGLDLRQLLDGFNEQWVVAATFLSPALVVELLTVTGAGTADYYENVDLDAPGEPVGWFGATGPSPMWQAIARELVERWVHHHQVLRAVGRPPLDGPIAATVEHVALAGGAARMGDLGATEGDEVEVRMGARPWTLRRRGTGWDLSEGAAAGAPRARVLVAAEEVAGVVTRGPTTAATTTVFEGDVDLAVAVAAGLASP